MTISRINVLCAVLFVIATILIFVSAVPNVWAISEQSISMKRSKKMIKLKRSEALKIAKSPGISDRDAEIIVSEFESAGVEFAPEELSEIEKAKKKYEDAVNEQHDNDGTDHYPAIVSYADHFHKVLQARIADLESQVNIIADENRSLEKRIEEKDAEIAGLKSRECNYGHMHPCDCIQHLIPESSELVKARENSINCEHRRDETDYEYYVRKLGFALDYIEALENARLRGEK
jgi:hypothetical protein